MKDQSFKQVFNKSANKKGRIDDKQDMKQNNNTTFQRTHTLTQNKGGGNKSGGK